MKSAATIIHEQLIKNGIQWGDAVAWATKKLGIEQCPPCAARREILNNVRKNGWAKTLQQIKETL